MPVRVQYQPSKVTAGYGLTLAAAREALFRWLWARQQGAGFGVVGSEEPWREELAWLGMAAHPSASLPSATPFDFAQGGLGTGGASEAEDPEGLMSLPEILPSEPALWGTGTAETPITQLRQLGVLPEALMNFLALLGWRPPEGTSEILSREQLLRLFNPEQIVSVPVRFDAEKLRALSHHWLQQADLERLLDLSLPYFLAAGYSPEDPPEPVRQWLKDTIRAVLSGLDFLSLLPQRTRFIFRYSAEQAIEFPDSRRALERAGSRDVIREFGNRVLGDSWLTAERLAAIVEEVKQATHWKGRKLLQPIQVVLTGLPYGPELAELVPIFETGSQLRLPVPVKSCRERVLEFCSLFV